MVAPSTTIWEMEPHTRAKHAILERYLDLWVPILTQGGFPEILYIDGFSGPGEYIGGHDGSPIIALNTALAATQRAGRHPKNAFFLFVEKDSDRASFLQTKVDAIQKPLWCRVKIAAGQSFADAFDELHQWYRTRERDLPPTFAFIDPFGWSGVPFRIVRDIMRYSACEVFVNFMYEEINRFLTLDAQADNFDTFFGTPKWRDYRQSQTRNRDLHDLYARQLREDAGAKYVRSFQMRNNRDVTDFYLFHATKSLKGLKVMKGAMWKVDSTGEFTFSDATDPDQLVLLGGETQQQILEREILSRFSGTTAAVKDIELFVVEHTAFRETHYKKVLKALEQRVSTVLRVVNASPKRKKGTFADKNMLIEFV